MKSKIIRDNELGGYRKVFIEEVTGKTEESGTMILPSPFGKGFCVYRNGLVAANLKLARAKQIALAI